MAMIASPNTLADLTSTVARSTTSTRSASVNASDCACCLSPSRRTAFSTMITAPSTSRPKSIAPRLIRLPDSPNAFITVTANSSERGMVIATTSPAAQIAQQNQQHEDHQQRALEEVSNPPSRWCG